MQLTLQRRGETMAIPLFDRLHRCSGAMTAIALNQRRLNENGLAGCAGRCSSGFAGYVEDGLALGVCGVLSERKRSRC